MRPEATSSGGSASRAKPTFWLLPTNTTLELSQTAPAWGYQYPDTVSKMGTTISLTSGLWQHTHYSALKHVLVWQLARHVSCSSDAEGAAMCIVASGPFGVCEDYALLSSLCAGRPLVVIDSNDAELTNNHGASDLCRELWDCRAATHLLRVTGNPPLHRRAFLCEYAPQGTLSVPYVRQAPRNARPSWTHGSWPVKAPSC